MLPKVGNEDKESYISIPLRAHVKYMAQYVFIIHYQQRNFHILTLQLSKKYSVCIYYSTLVTLMDSTKHNAIL